MNQQQIENELATMRVMVRNMQEALSSQNILLNTLIQAIEK